MEYQMALRLYLKFEDVAVSTLRPDASIEDVRGILSMYRQKNVFAACGYTEGRNGTYIWVKPDDSLSKPGLFLEVLKEIPELIVHQHQGLVYFYEGPHSAAEHYIEELTKQPNVAGAGISVIHRLIVILPVSQVEPVNFEQLKVNIKKLAANY